MPEGPVAERRLQVVVRRTRRVVGLERGTRDHPQAVGLEGHSHAAAGRMEVARAEHGIHGVEEVSRRKDRPAQEGHRTGLAGVGDSGPVEAGDIGLAEGDIDPAEGGTGLAEAGIGPAEGHHKAVDSPGAEVLKEGLAGRTGVRTLRTEVLLTKLARAKARNALFEMRSRLG